ncbi:MAG: hypothetical protein FD156_1780 [Nitrospirae bacterium]|nr:MAG: hypothetical protein FD156_1780 [Nitrospirota bacterium]
MLIALVAPIAYCLYYLLQGQFLLKGNSDTIDVNIPYFIAVNDAVSTDIIPSWTRYTFTGFSLIGSPTLLWYPLNWLAFIVDKAYVPHVMTALAWLHFIGVAFAGYIFFREIAKSSFWAVVSATAYTFSLPVVYGLSVVTSSYLVGYLFTPLALYVIHTHRNRTGYLNALYIALITFALVTGAFIQIAIYSLGIIFLYAFSVGFFGTESSTRDKKTILYFLGGIVLGIFLSAPMLLPMFAIGSDTSRDFAALDISTIYEYMAKGSPGLLWRLFSPNAFGHDIYFPNHEMGGVNYVESMNSFCGIIILFLSGYAITVRRSPVTVFFSFLFIGIILVTITPLAYIHIFLFGLKPVLNRISYFLPLAIASLAAVGGRHLDIANNLPFKKIVLNPIWLLLLVAAMYVMPNNGYFYLEITRGIVFVGIFIITYNILKYRKHLWHIIVLSLVVIEVIWSGHLMTTVQVHPLMVEVKDFYPYGSPKESFPLNKNELELYRVLLYGDTGNELNKSGGKLNNGIYYGYASPWGYNNAYSLGMVLLLTKLADKEPIGGLGRDMYFNATPPYDRVADLTSAGFIVAYKDKKWQILEDRRQRCLPRISLFYNYEKHETLDEAAVRLKSPDFPFKQTVMLTSNFNLPIGPYDPDSSVKFLRNGNSNVAIEVKSKTPCILLFNDVYAKGWRAFIDDSEVEILEGNIAFRAVYVPQGDHLVEFRYNPPMLNLSLFVSFAGIIICIILYKKRNSGTRDAPIND